MHIMNSMEQENRRIKMIEKAYKTMGSVAASNIVLGIIIIAVGLVAGVITIVGGARLIKSKSGLTF